MKSAGDRTSHCTTPFFTFLIYILFPKMNLGTSVLHSSMASDGLLQACWRCIHNRAVVDSPHCRMQLSDRARRVLFVEPIFFLERPVAMSAVIIDNAVNV